MENEVMKPTSWNNQVCLNRSEWLTENVKGLDQTIEEMLRMVELADGESPKKSELIARIQEISNQHHSLVHRYNKLAVELTQSEGAVKKATFDPQETPPFQTPKKTLSMLYSDNETPGFELSPGSGVGSSDTTRSESSLLSSDSDSESCNSSLPKMVHHTEQGQERGCAASPKGECGECGVLQSQILDYVKELGVSTDKLRFAEEEIFRLKNELQNNAAVMINLGSLESLLAAAKNEIKLHEAELKEENNRSMMLQRQVVDLEDQLELEQKRTLELRAGIKNYTTDLSNSEAEIRRLASELQDASGNFALEKWQLESSIAKMSESLKSHETRAKKELQVERDLLTAVIKKHEAEKIEMEEKQEAMKIKWEDCMLNNSAMMASLNMTLDAVMVQRDEANAKLGKADAEISHRDDRIRCLEGDVHELGCENKLVSVEKNNAEKEIMELKSRIEVLEKEVGVQAMKTDNVAEEKREAIRQLCFSIDHFRNAYKEARDAYVARVQSRAMVV